MGSRVAAPEKCTVEGRIRMFNSRAGFTLAELLIVVAVIALVSGVGFAIYSGLLTDSNEAVSISMQQELMNLINAHMVAHGGRLPDGFDSLLRDQAASPYGGGFTDFGTAQYPLLVADDPKDAIYAGYDTNGDNVADSGAGSLGVNPAVHLGAFRSVTVAQLSDSDVETLRRLGITTLYDIDQSRDYFHGNVTYVRRPLKKSTELEAGEAPAMACILDPATCRNGIPIYEDFGVDLSDTDVYTREPANDTTNSDYPIMANDLDAAGRAAALQTQRFVVLGIGPNCTLVGDRKGGVQEAPACPIVAEGEYNRYFLVIKMPGGPTDMNAAVAGILDAKGKTIRGARAWATRTE